MSGIMIRRLELGQLQANAYLVWREDREDLFIMDPGDDPETAEREIEKSGRKLTDILLTHGHFDHILGAAPLAKKYGAHIHIHPNDAHMLLHPGKALYMPAWCDSPFEPAEADCLFPAGDEDWEIEVCGIPFIGFRTPGHTTGSVCLLNEESGSLFTGDTLFAESYGRTDFPGGSMEEMKASLKRLLGMDRSLTVYSGHGAVDTMENIARRWRL